MTLLIDVNGRIAYNAETVTYVNVFQNASGTWQYQVTFNTGNYYVSSTAYLTEQLAAAAVIAITTAVTPSVQLT